MPVIYELFQSRTGSQVGLGALILPRMFFVQCDTQTEDPARLLQLHRAGVPFRSTHPWNTQVQATEYTIVDRLNPLTYIIVIGYNLPEALERQEGQLVAGWSVSIRGMGEQERLLQELADPAAPALAPRIVGPPAYKEAEDGATAPFRVKVDASAYRQLTRKTSRVPVGWDRKLPAMNVMLKKETGTLSWNRILSAASYLQQTNDAIFLGAGAGHCRFEDMSVDGRQAGAGPQLTARRDYDQAGIRPHGKADTGWVWSVALSFYLSARRLDQTTHTHVHEFPDGSQGVVESSGGVVQGDTFRTGTQASLRALLELFV